MASQKPVWGIDIGQCALKAVKLKSGDSGVEVDEFEIIEHPQILSQPDVDRDQLIRNALEQFLGRHSVAGCTVAVAVPGQSSFTRFVKLPPVEPKKVPDIVRFEAEQQIPFPINDVIWRWQTFQDPNSPDIELGIFAMKKVDVATALRHFSNVDLRVDVVQMAPLALYNFMNFDGQRAEQGATLLADVGADKTDLVVADGANIWTRTIQIGGNDFTEALVRGFKLSFAKAEKLKRTAASSKYARQVFQTMRPVFSDLVQEIQRSIGYYSSLHREARFVKLVGLGNGFRLPGLGKFLEQNLNLSVARVDSFNRLGSSDGSSEAAMSEHALSLGVAYGLGLQGLGLSDIATSLLPDEVVSQRRWKAKRPVFATAAGLLLLACGTTLWSAYADRNALADGQSGLASAERIVRDYESLKSRQARIGGGLEAERRQVRNRLELFGHRSFWPACQKLISEAVFSVARDQDMYIQAVTAPNPQTQRRLLQQMRKRIPRDQRQQVFIQEISTEFKSDITQVTETDVLNAVRAKLGLSSTSKGPDAPAAGEQAEPMPGFVVTVLCRTPMDRDGAVSRICAPLRVKLQEIAMAAPQMRPEMQVLAWGKYTYEVGQTRAGGRNVADAYGYGMEEMALLEAEGAADQAAEGIESPDPVIPGESTSGDTTFGFGFCVGVRSDGVEAERLTDIETRK